MLDPYMGGGTTLVEALAAQRLAIGNDLNSLATFITRVKVTPLVSAEREILRIWATKMVPELKYLIPAEEVAPFIDAAKSKNMSLARARFIKKVIAAALASIAELPTINMKNFAKCVVLRVSQWALDGRRCHTALEEFRQNLVATTLEMLEAIQVFGRATRTPPEVVILNGDSSEIDRASFFLDDRNRKAALVVTSPPYPGVHVLYHRWQVDGRRETPAPYWIADCDDGNGASFYNFADRRQNAADGYFRTSLRSLTAIRRVIRDGGYMVQMLAFNQPEEQLARYLRNMEDAGFAEVQVGKPRIWRSVPNRKWHASLRGNTNSATEVVLIHRAV